MNKVINKCNPKGSTAMRIILTLTLLAGIGLTAFSQDNQDTGLAKPIPAYSYAYISIEGKAFSKKLKVEVDLGDTPEQIQAGKEYSEILTNKKSYAAVLNYMVENQFELVETLDYSLLYAGSGGTYGIIFIMRKKR